MPALVTFRALAVALAIAAAAGAPAVAARTLSGAGATFPYPLYAKWAAAYRAKTGIGLNYQAIGSGGGIKQITAATVDFGASDMPLPPAVLKKDGLVQFPTVVGGVVPVVNLRGIGPGELRLSGPVLADIFLGRITMWNDPRIRALNPGLALPDAEIYVVHRSDGSGTTFTFTEYLSKVSPSWKKIVGAGTAVQWPTGVGGKGNAGVANYIRQLDGGIGYLEYAFVLQNRFAWTLLRNRAGNFVPPTVATFKAAAANADWATAPGFYVLLTNEPGARSWPITGATFVLMPRRPRDPKEARAVLAFFDWAYRHGDAMALKLDYVPMPSSVVELIRHEWATSIIGPNGEPVYSPRP